MVLQHRESCDQTVQRAGEPRLHVMFSCILIVAMFGAADAFAQTPAPGAAAAPRLPATQAPPPGEFIEEPVAADVNDSGEFVEQSVDGGAVAAPAPSAPAAGPFGFLSTAARSSNLLGDMWGFRTLLSQYGMTLSVVEQSEILGNVSGGSRQGFAYEGLTTATLQMDTQRAFGWYGGLFNASGCRSMAAISAPTISSACRRRAASRPIARRGLWELWYQQKFSMRTARH